MAPDALAMLLGVGEVGDTEHAGNCWYIAWGDLTLLDSNYSPQQLLPTFG